MKIRVVAKLLFVALMSAGATANAAIVTTGAHDFHGATAADQASLTYSSYLVQNTGTETVHVVATVKRNPASAADGSQTVTIEGYNTDGSSLNGVVYAVNNSLLTTKTFFAAAGADYFTKTVTFTAAQAPSTIYFDVQISLPPGSFLTGVYAN